MIWSAPGRMNPPSRGKTKSDPRRFSLSRLLHHDRVFFETTYRDVQTALHPGLRHFFRTHGMCRRSGKIQRYPGAGKNGAAAKQYQNPKTSFRPGSPVPGNGRLPALSHSSGGAHRFRRKGGQNLRTGNPPPAPGPVGGAAGGHPLRRHYGRVKYL